MSAPKDGPQARTFIDNTGVEVATVVPNPAEVDNDDTPGLAERAPCPPEQRFGPAQNEPADYIPFD